MIGRAVRDELAAQGHAVRSLRRDGPPPGDYLWDARPGSVPAEAVEWADAVVSLNGASLNHLPWTARYRAELRRSRVDATAAVAGAIAEAAEPPAVWVSGSAVGYYGDAAGDADLDETSPRGTSFLAGVVADWEAATGPAAGVTRVVHARTGVVLGRGGAVAPLALATRLGLGSRIGPGTQWWPWISLADEARAIVFALTADLRGPVNLVGPVPATATDITRALATALRRPHWFVLPARAIRVAMAGASELLLGSQKVHPVALAQSGFEFRHATPAAAIAAAWAPAS
jgi:uncharacterized protein (TIGR01777 family)